MREQLALLKKFLDKKVVCFGTGRFGEKAAEILPVKIAYFVDSTPAKWGQSCGGTIIRQPDVLLEENLDQLAIIITSAYTEEIRDQLQKMGFEANRHFWDGCSLFYHMLFMDGQEILLDYPVHSVPRYGHGKPPHPQLFSIIIDGMERYKARLEQILKFQPFFERIPRDRAGNGLPFWNNMTLPGLDAASIYGWIGINRPNIYFEIGSGNSTTFARRAIRDHGLATRIISVDPEPRSEIDALCDRVIRQPLEDIDLQIVNQLSAGDIIFVDNSHRAFMNSDATVVFMDILPKLKPGVIVGFHDIFLPFDYPPNWADRYYSEQYLLACYLLARGPSIQVELPNHFCCTNPELRPISYQLWETPSLDGVPKYGAAMWISIK